MIEKKLNNRCFSLTETVIATAILIFILVALIVLYNNYLKSFNNQQARIAMESSARETVKELQSAALQADQIVTSHSFSGTTYTTGAHTVVLELPSIDGSGNIVSGKFDYVVFYLTGKNLYRRIQVDAASSRPSGLNKISDVVSTLSFTYDNADLSKATKIDTDLEMQAIAGSQNVSYELRQEIYLRNK
jgi:hypothetical protein